jgi:translation elongation factor EF-4
MSMHLAPVYFTTTRSGRKSKPSSNKRLAEATAKHDKWLLDRGLHPNQRDLQRAFKGKQKIDLPDLKVESQYELSNGIGNGFKRGIMANLHNETEKVRKEILDKASRVMPLYNKGGLQYATPETDLKMVGSKTRRG